MDTYKRSAGQAYCPPQITFVGHLADVTRQDEKLPNVCDGETFNEIDQGSAGSTGPCIFPEA